MRTPLLLLAQVTVDPNAGAGPGGPQLETLVNWGAGLGLIVCVGAMVIAAMVWALGAHTQNFNQSHTGKRGLAIAGGAAGAIAAAAGLVNFAAGLGSQVR